MPREAVYSALILKNRVCKFAGVNQESNREIWLLTSEVGLVQATVFGGVKSKLRAHTAPFNSGKVWIYHNPVKDSRKVTDFDVHSWRPGLRELYERTMTATAVAETILATHGGGGNWPPALKLAEEVFDALECSSEDSCSRILVYFFWKWTELLGLQPQLEHCSVCGKITDTITSLWYSTAEGEVFCPSCKEVACVQGRRTGLHSELLPLGLGCRRWLTTVQPLAPCKLESYTMDNKSMAEAKTFTSAILARALDKRPASWDW